MQPIKATMLGEFSLSAGDIKIADQDNRSRKVWLLLAYLLCHRTRSISQEELVDLLYGEDPKGANPANSLKTALHRVRTLLDQLWPGAGRDLILYQDGGYRWNPSIPTMLDIDEFDRLCHPSSDSEDAELEGYLSALSLYRGV